jgi:saccharopine dehydrogenase-like NADP-dependent oxidoreductase
MATVLVIGGGGREHALAWKLAQSDEVSQVLVAKGNGGTSRASNPKIQNLAMNIAAAPTVVEACQQHNVSLVVVGPEVVILIAFCLQGQFLIDWHSSFAGSIGQWSGRFAPRGQHSRVWPKQVSC